MTADELELQLEQVRAKQRAPRGTKARKTTTAPPLVDAATRAAHDYEPEDLEPAPPPPPPPSSPDIPAHLRQYLVHQPASTGSRLERAQEAPDAYAGARNAILEADTRAGRPPSTAAAHAAGEAARAAAWAFGYLGCDWAGLYRMADARRRAGLPTDDLDAEALKRGDEPAEVMACPPATTPPPASS